MKHLDELVINLRRTEEKAKRSQKIDLSTEQIIDGKSYNFASRNLLNEHLKMILPVNFQDVPIQIQEQKYLNAQKPELILSNPDHTVDFSLNLLKNKVDSDSLPAYLQRVKYTLGRVNPSTLFFEEEQIEGVNLSVMLLDFKSFSLGGAIYNLMFLTVVSGRLLMGSFNCSFAEWEDWKPFMSAMLETMEDMGTASN